MNEYSFIVWHDRRMAATAKTAKRTARREQRRQQLIDATMKCIARKGMGSTTLADVASEAGLSQGIVNLHFESKDNLLNETLRYLADEYKTQFNKTLEKSGPDAAAKLQALIELDLRPSICDRQKIAVWFAFWGEVKSRPTYRKICDERDNTTTTLSSVSPVRSSPKANTRVLRRIGGNRLDVNDERAVVVLPDQPDVRLTGTKRWTPYWNICATYFQTIFRSEKSMHIDISKDALTWQKIAREYADNYLQPHEVEAELNDGVLPDEITQTEQETGNRARLHGDRRAEESRRPRAPDGITGRDLGAARPRDQCAVLVLSRSAVVDVRRLHRGADCKNTSCR